MLHTARCKYRTQKWRKKSPSAHHRTTSLGYNFATKAHIDNRKNLLSTNISPTCPHNMVNVGPLAAEIVSLVWGTLANFNGFRVLAASQYRTLVVGVSQSLRHGTRNGITELSQRAPPMFGWAAITLGIGPHSSYQNNCIDSN